MWTFVQLFIVIAAIYTLLCDLGEIQDLLTIRLTLQVRCLRYRTHHRKWHHVITTCRHVEARRSLRASIWSKHGPRSEVQPAIGPTCHTSFILHVLPTTTTGHCRHITWSQLFTDTDTVPDHFAEFASWLLIIMDWVFEFVNWEVKFHQIMRWHLKKSTHFNTASQLSLEPVTVSWQES